MMKRIMNGIAVMCILLMACDNVLAAAVDYDFNINGLCFKRLYNGRNVKVVACNVGDGKVEIPAMFTVNDTVFTVTRVGGNLLNNMTNIHEVILPNTIERIETKAFCNCGIVSFCIPDSVTYIASQAFEMCQNLKVVTIGRSVKTMGKKLFNGCKSLQRIISLTDSPIADVGDGTFTGVDMANCILTVPEGAKATYAASQPWSSFLNIVENMPSSVIPVMKADAQPSIEYYTLDGRRLNDVRQGIMVKKRAVFIPVRQR